ncbi:M20/M25/M40 family metallo-hydrolase [Bacillus sonorensis]|uniref:M20/M25/M40 family metallo-hydrolase n=1 Tax=Bacillus sonorensis TaxID=119858 RepID=UPI002281FF6F|nr:M20/M25/M40 family metallo-hydrolase [Bacillus sonorensis]MCZ0067585.1 M20/M25/M40 family metallo-hydrolase [Bacillus sonorensis]MCZ0096115.1 M20/M25/M40 family metallo-hydrolase [Bacillus sonorensis]MEC1518982.1 M20/M25/M40 family metallo-hydrolase [Bacillus sonorensis]
MKWQTEEQLKQLLISLVQYESISGTSGEAALAEYMYNLLKDRSYFRKHSDHLKLHPMKDGRSFLTALVQKPAKKKTVLLLSHFDIVDTADYGEFKHMACKPLELMDSLAEKKDLLPERVKKDLESGEWLFGRGSMDMKAGLAVQFAMLERAMNGTFDGNLLLIAVPDEEVNSQGMIEAVPVLKALEKEYDIQFTACLNCEPMFEKHPGDSNLYVYSGSIGKALAGFFCKGIETHVGEPFSGLNANLMVSEINRLLELNVGYCEEADGEVTPPPANLMQKDLKEAYSVQTPHTAVSLFNVLMMKRSASELHSMLLDTAKKAAINIKTNMEQKVLDYQRFDAFTPIERNISVMTFEELVERAREKAGGAEAERVLNFAFANRGELGDRDFSANIVSELISLCKDDAPMIVLFYSPPFYPAVSSKDDPLIQETIGDVTAYAAGRYGLSFEQVQYFPGLSDLSYLQLQKQSVDAFTDNMPLFQRGYFLPDGEENTLFVPVLNIGPVGKDPHKWTERLHVPFSFSTLPDLIQLAVGRLLA